MGPGKPNKAFSSFSRYNSEVLYSGTVRLPISDIEIGIVAPR